MLLGDLISELRQDRNMNQKDLANVLNVSVATISHYESEKSFPDVQMLVRIADFFGVSTDYLLGRTRIRMDFNTFCMQVRMLDGSMTSADRVMQRFLKLSDKSQLDVINLMDLFQMRDDLRHTDIIKPLDL
ncbi:MAG: helix-turn-helix domain-containing protein [Clostridiales bacterium]|jgi:DNA-binding XRE family transcriptional regulator|nr:helix-turn-helix domain-containing protein [Clostridiales bacterium]